MGTLPVATVPTGWPLTASFLPLRAIAAATSDPSLPGPAGNRTVRTVSFVAVSQNRTALSAPVVMMRLPLGEKNTLPMSAVCPPASSDRSGRSFTSGNFGSVGSGPSGLKSFARTNGSSSGASGTKAEMRVTGFSEVTSEPLLILIFGGGGSGGNFPSGGSFFGSTGGGFGPLPGIVPGAGTTPGFGVWPTGGVGPGTTTGFTTGVPAA